VSTPVPLSGFLNLSAVSWQAQGLWPCFMPLPFLGSSLQSFSLTGIACLSRGPLSRLPAPLQLSTGEPKTCCASPFTPGFTDVHAFTQLPGSPVSYGLPFHGPRSVSWLSRASLSRARFFSPASPTSELSSPCETVPPASSCPSAGGRCSPGLLPLRSFLLPHLGFSTRPASWTGHAPLS